MDSAVLISLSLVPKLGCLCTQGQLARLQSALLDQFLWFPSQVASHSRRARLLLVSSHPQASFMFISSLFFMRGQDLSTSSQKDHPFWFLGKKVWSLQIEVNCFHTTAKNHFQERFISNFSFWIFQAQLNSPLQISSGSSYHKHCRDISIRLCPLFCVVGVSSPNRALIYRGRHRGRGMGRDSL